MTDAIPEPAPESPRPPEPTQPPQPPSPPPPPPPIEVQARPYEPKSEKGPIVDAPPPKPPPSGGGFSFTSGSGSAGSGGPTAPSGAATPPAPGKNTGWSVFCHLGTLVDFCLPWLLVGLIPPLVIWLARKDEDPEVDYHGRESLNFQLNMIFWALASVPLLCACGVGALIMIVLPFWKLVLVLIAAIRAADGERFRYPFIYRLL